MSNLKHVVARWDHNLCYLREQVHMMENNDDMLEQLGLMENQAENPPVAPPPAPPPMPPHLMEQD